MPAEPEPVITHVAGHVAHITLNRPASPQRHRPPLADGFRYVRVPSRLSDTPATVRTGAPALGEHTVEVLRDLGYSRAEIDRLIASGTVAVPE